MILNIKNRSVTVKKILQGDFLEKEVLLQGWVKSHRVHGKNISFIWVNDGSTFVNLQVIYKKPIKDIPIGSAVEILGKIVLSRGEGQNYEFDAEEIKILKESVSFPIQKKEHTFEYLREVSHLRHRTGIFGAVNAVRAGLYQLINKFFYEEGFIWVQSPILTGNSCEGGAEAFMIKDSEKFFKKPALLSVSGQFHAEALALGLKQVYTFGPTFRAEKSNSSNHLAEFWMIEPEVSFCDLKQLMDLMEKFMKYVVKGVLKNYATEIKFLSSKLEDNGDLWNKLKNVSSRRKYKRLEYKKAILLLVKAGFDISFGDDLNSEQERYITKKIGGPVFVYNYPKYIKSFYMKDIDCELVSSVDLLVPGVGELMGGSERESSLEMIRKKAEEMQIPIDQLKWYLDLREYGYYSSSGFGCGFERLVLYVTGLKNIKDSVSYPVCYNHLYY